MAITEPIRDKRKIKKLANHFLKRGQLRNYCLVILCVYTALRISDLLRLRWEDVYDFQSRRIRKSVTLTEQKTGKSKIIALNKQAVRALAMYASQIPEPRGFIIVNNRTKKAISRIQAYRIIRYAAEALHFQERVSCHSLRKSFGYHAWKSGVSPVVIMEIFNHSSLNVTRRYLGVSQDDKNKAYLLMNLSS
jgi:integrase